MTRIIAIALLASSMGHTSVGNRAFPVSAPIERSIQTPRAPAGSDSPWSFFKENVRHADSVGKWLALIVFTVLLASMYAVLWFDAAIVLVVVLAAVSPRVRDSRLVRTGFGVFLVGVLPLVAAGLFNDNPLGFGFLFTFCRPVAAILMSTGAAFALLRRPASVPASAP